eukprot:6955850-Prymnesium_polylepis.1
MHRGESSKWSLAITALTSGRLMSQYKDATLGAFLDTCTSNPKLRAAIAGQSGNYGIPPSEVFALTVALTHGNCGIPPSEVSYSPTHALTPNEQHGASPNEQRVT